MRSPSNVFYIGKSSEKLNGMEKKATHGKEARLTFRTIFQCKIHWRGTACCVFWLWFQRRLSQAITLISPKIESCPRSGWRTNSTRGEPGWKRRQDLSISHLKPGDKVYPCLGGPNLERERRVPPTHGVRYRAPAAHPRGFRARGPGRPGETRRAAACPRHKAARACPVAA